MSSRNCARLFAALALTSLCSSESAAQNRSADSTAVVAAVSRFHSSLKAGDSAAVMSLLADDVEVLESGERETRALYREHHLAADIAFAKQVPSVRTVQQVVVRGDAAWIVATSQTTGQFNGRAVNSDGVELIVLSRGAQGWKIAAIHWSSRAKR